METVIGTEADRKGGHIAWRDGRLVLRETAQAPEEPSPSSDFRRWRYYNTNNLWLDLEALRRSDAPAPLPLIVNRKTVDPADPRSRAVIQTETAMGAAIGVFEGARALCVPRSRFVPVKTTDDLLALRSDVYRLLRDGAWSRRPSRRTSRSTRHYFKRIEDFERALPARPALAAATAGASWCAATSRFGARVVARGRVEVCADVPDDTLLTGVYRPRGDEIVSTGQPREDAKIAFDKERRRRALSRLASRMRFEADDVSHMLPFEEVVAALGATSRARRRRAGDPARRDRRHGRPPPRRVRPLLPPLAEHPRALGADRRGAQARRGDAADRRLPDRRPVLRPGRPSPRLGRPRDGRQGHQRQRRSRSAPSSAPTASCR